MYMYDLTNYSSDGLVSWQCEAGDQDPSELHLVLVVDIIGPLDPHGNILLTQQIL